MKVACVETCIANGPPPRRGRG
ncbi:MAG: hypothetical protein K0S21_3474, partial [Rhizobiaceae bacterium]|nr:hypothetical protein [Rhizobiaceae bacterium]